MKKMSGHSPINTPKADPPSPRSQPKTGNIQTSPPRDLLVSSRLCPTVEDPFPAGISLARNSIDSPKPAITPVCRQVLTRTFFIPTILTSPSNNHCKMVVLIQDSNDLKEKLKEAGEKLIIIDFFATWCGPCKSIAPQLEALAKEYTDIVFLKVDVDECEDIAQEYEINSMPTFIFIKNGETVLQFSGASLQKIKDGIQAHKN